MNRDQFAETIKQKYPQYQGIDNKVLVATVLRKHPQYQKQISQDDNVVTKFVKGMIEPAVNYGKYVGEAAYQANRFLVDPNYRKVVTGQPISSQQWEQLNKRPETLFYKGNDVEKIADVPQSIKTGIKAGAGMESYFVPGGVGVKGMGTGARMIAGGALAGGLSGVAQGDDITAGNILRGAGMGALVGGSIAGAGKVLPKIAESGVGQKLPKLGNIGERVENYGKDYAIKSTRIADRGQKVFKKLTREDLGDYISRNKLYGQNLDKLDEFIKPQQEAMDAITINSGKSVDIQSIVDRFNKAITELETPENLRVPQNRALLDYLKNERDLFIQSTNGSRQVGLGSLVETRRGIDVNTPKLDFMPGEQGKGRALGSVYRDVIHSSAPGSKEMGRELQKAYKFKDLLESAPKGKNTQPFGLGAKTAATVGALTAKVPVVGAAVGMVADKVANSPRTIAMESRAIQGVGKALQTPGMIAKPINTVGQKLPTGTSVARNTIIQGGANVVNKPRKKTFQKSKITYPSMDVGGY